MYTKMIQKPTGFYSGFYWH